MLDRMLTETAADAEKGGNTISDGRLQCTYQALPGIFARLDSFFESRLAAADCTIFRCGNSLPEAVVLLYLLARQKHLLLLPRLSRKLQEEFEDQNLPQFCKHKLSVDLSLPTVDFEAPHSYLEFQANTNFKGQADVLRGPGKVFLRTSGSTAQPRLVMHVKEKLFQNALNCVHRFELRHLERILIPVPIYHMYGLGAAFLPGVIAGASLNVLESTNVINYMARERQFNPDVSFMTPPLIEMILCTRKSSYPYRLVVTAGARINETTYENFEKKFGPLVNLYGSTELGAIATSNLKDLLEVRSKGIVLPMPGVEIRLKDEAPEILCRHDTGFEDYVDKRGLRITQEKIEWFATKDLGQLMAEGRFKVLDRTDNSMNRSGLLVAFSEVESIMEQCIAGIRQVAVSARGEENYRGKKLVAFCELQQHARMDGKQIRSRCFDVMMRHMVPDEVFVIGELPRLPNGKLDRQSLAKFEIRNSKQ